MTDHNEPKNGENIDFMSSPSLQKIIKKSKRKQTIKYIFITFFTTSLLLAILFSGSQYILSERIENNQDSLYNSIHGANITDGGTTFNYSLFSVTAETIYRKNIGDRSIIWDKTTKKIPLFGKIATIEKESGWMGINKLNEKAKRFVRFNDFNDEREMDFYYPYLSYGYLPHELDTAVHLDQNKLIEIALSFKEPMTIPEVAKKLGLENVNWLWVNTATPKQMKRMEQNLIMDSLKTKGGEDAFGFEVTPSQPYSEKNGQAFLNILEKIAKRDSHKSLIQQVLKGIHENTKATKGNISINGAVVTGAPDELKRFQNINFIRASVIGATIDEY